MIISSFVRIALSVGSCPYQFFRIILQAAAGGGEEFFKLEEYGESFIHLSRELDASIISVSYITPSLYFLQQLWQIELLLRSTGFQRRSAGIIPRH